MGIARSSAKLGITLFSRTQKSPSFLNLMTPPLHTASSNFQTERIGLLFAIKNTGI